MRSILEKTLVSFCVGLCIAVTIGILIVLLSRVPVVGVPFAAVEKFGTDLGMQVHARLWLQERQRDARGGLEPSYVFLDIGRAACLAFFENQNAARRDKREVAEKLCRAGHPASPKLVAGQARSLIQSDASAKPAVIVLDISALLDPGFAKDLREIADKDIPIIAISQTRAKHEGTRLAIEALASSFDADRPKNLVLATDVAETDRDYVLRRYAATRLAEADTPQGSDMLLPSLGFAAAALAVDRVAALDLFNQMRSRRLGECNSASLRAVAEKLFVDAVGLCKGAASEAGDLNERVLFTVPSLAYDRVITFTPGASSEPRKDGMQISGSAVPSSVYRRIPAVFEGGRFAPVSDEWLKDAVVVIGTSDRSGNDWHITPLGQMTGAEVVINAARAYRMYRPPAEEALGWHLLHKVLLSVLSAAVFAIAWFVTWFIGENWVAEGRPARFAKGAVMGAVFLAGMAATFVVVTWVNAVGSGLRPADILTPVLAVALEGFAEVTYLLIKFLDKRLETRVRSVFDCIGKWRRKKAPAPNAVSPAAPVTEAPELGSAEKT